MVSEAGESSGALITARHALEQGKLLFAIPGSIGSESAGTNHLIKTGISVATEPQDILSPLLTRYPELTHVYVPAATAKLRSYGNAKTKNVKQAKIEIENKPQAVSENQQDFENAEEFVVKIKPVEPLTESVLSGETSEIILSVLKENKPMTADEIVKETGLPISDVMTELTFMEIDGSVAVSVGGRYTVRNF